MMVPCWARFRRSFGAHDPSQYRYGNARASPYSPIIVSPSRGLVLDASRVGVRIRAGWVSVHRVSREQQPGVSLVVVLELRREPDMPRNAEGGRVVEARSALAIVHRAILSDDVQLRRG